MKKITALLLVLSMSFMMGACGQKAEDTKETEAQTEAAATEAAVSEDAETAETEAETIIAESETEAAETDESEEELFISLHTGDDFLGEYQDAWSGRAYMNIDRSGKPDKYNISVHWGSSASSERVWSFTCSFNSDTDEFICSGFAYCADVTYGDEEADNKEEYVYSDEDAVIAYVEDHFEVSDPQDLLEENQFFLVPLESYNN